MGWCHEFGPQIRHGCGHPMVAESMSCQCPECGTVCWGRFAGCHRVWANGPQAVDARRDQVASKPPTIRAPLAAGGGAAGDPVGSRLRSALPAVAVPASASRTAVTAEHLENAQLNNENGQELIELRTDIAALAATMVRTTGGTRYLAARHPDHDDGPVRDQLEDLCALSKEIVVRLSRIEDQIATLEPPRPVEEAKGSEPAAPSPAPTIGVRVSTRRASQPASRQPGARGYPGRS